MSSFLGPIHFWLYGKIDKQEALTKTIANLAVKEGWISEVDAAEYVYDLPALESAIDVGNIHGWLQDCISYAEGRYAGLVTALLQGENPTEGTGAAGGTDARDSSRLDQIKAAACAFGAQYALEAGTSAGDAYKAFEDFFLNGMPCDRVNRVTGQGENELGENSISWEMNQDIHAASWKDGNTDVYYQIRKAVMDGMTKDAGLKVEMADAFHYAITAA